MRISVPYLRDHLAYVSQLWRPGIWPLFPAKKVPLGPGGNGCVGVPVKYLGKYTAINPRRAEKRRVKMNGADGKCEGSERKVLMWLRNKSWISSGRDHSINMDWEPSLNTSRPWGDIARERDRPWWLVDALLYKSWNFGNGQTPRPSMDHGHRVVVRESKARWSWVWCRITSYSNGSMSVCWSNSHKLDDIISRIHMIRGLSPCGVFLNLLEDLKKYTEIDSSVTVIPEIIQRKPERSWSRSRM